MSLIVKQKSTHTIIQYCNGVDVHGYIHDRVHTYIQEVQSTQPPTNDSPNPMNQLHPSPRSQQLQVLTIHHAFVSIAGDASSTARQTTWTLS